MPNLRHVYLLRDGQAQVLTIPQEFTLSSTEVLLRKEGNRLIIEPISSGSLLSLLATLEDIPENFPNVDEGLLPLDDITL
ncbi:antitoxin [Argonema galeatum]|uniref:antitoxin n=1 Tax=Argonema galeatum TaxID=2942762 RepID=UPI002012691A|nr:AbrB/MazE/SpoVT family DNA-binding domain-containing protein [Argonema galeatum]MCL1464161.1 AbrB/MazE/SpoVT family DNA-binding domain-containing protein [Argonema galeatum A003/A1]